MRTFVAAFLSATSFAIAQGTLTGPSLGLIYDAAAQAIRPVWGIPGASSAGARIDTGFAIASAAISPAQDYALAVAAGGSLKLLTFTSNGPSIRDAGVTATPDRMTLSPAGSAAVLYYKNAQSIQVLSGLPGSLHAGPMIGISSLAQAPDVFAISDDATIVLAGVVENVSRRPVRHTVARPGQGGDIFLIPQDGNAPRSIRRLRHASAMAFFRTSHDLVVADDGANTISMLSDAGGAAAQSWTFTDPALVAPDSVQVSPDNKSVLAGSSKGQVLTIMTSGGANALFVSCSCAPTEVHPMSPAAIYQVTEANSGLLWILDTTPPNPRMLFVPVPAENSAPGVEQ